MSKIKLLLDVVQDVRALADSLQAVADFIQLGTASPEETPAQPVDSTPPKHTAPQITIDQVRTLLAEKSGEDKTQAVKALLYKYDAGKLSGVKPEDYAALMEEARKGEDRRTGSRLRRLGGRTESHGRTGNGSD